MDFNDPKDSCRSHANITENLRFMETNLSKYEFLGTEQCITSISAK